MDFLFDVPLWIMGPAILLALAALSLSGLAVFRRRILPRLRFGEGDPHFSTAMVSSIMVFYGLALALIAVNVWETYEEVARTTSREASSLAALYRDVSEYPEPTRSALRESIREYTDHLVRAEWPLQRRGEVPKGGVERMDRLQATLMSFEPKTKGQELLAGEALHAYNLVIDARRQRLDAVDTQLPGVMWMVIVLGALISLYASYWFPVVDPRVHATLVGLLAVFIGLVIFMVLTLDRPFRGDLGLPSQPYELIYEQLMSH